MSLYPALLILLLLLPACAAIIVACLGQGRALLVRQISLGVSVAGAVIAVVLAFGFLTQRAEMKETTFRPEFVPGSTAQSPHTTTWNLIDFNTGRDANAAKNNLGAIQFYIGVDGINIWFIVPTSILD